MQLRFKLLFFVIEVPREVVLWGSRRTSEPSHAAPASVPANLLWQCVPALLASFWHCHPPFSRATSCFQISGDTAGPSGRPVQVSWWDQVSLWVQEEPKVCPTEKREQLCYHNHFMCRSTSHLLIQHPSLLWKASKRPNQPKEKTGACHHVFTKGMRNRSNCVKSRRTKILFFYFAPPKCSTLELQHFL